LTAATCALYFIPFIIEAGGIFIASWDTILFVLWIALFGVFGKVRCLSITLALHDTARGRGNGLRGFGRLGCNAEATRTVL
jgi:hypothetical protein